MSSKENKIFLTAFQGACMFFLNEEGAINAYSYYLKNKKYILCTLDDNQIIDDKAFFDVKYVLCMLDSLLYIRNYGIYFRELPYETSPSKQIQYKDFLSYRSSFYAGGGEITLDKKTVLRLEFDAKIMNEFVKKEYDSTLFNHTYHTNHTKQVFELIHNALIKRREEIFQIYKKDYLEFTEKEFGLLMNKHLGFKLANNKTAILLGLIKN